MIIAHGEEDKAERKMKFDQVCNVVYRGRFSRVGIETRHVLQPTSAAFVDTSLSLSPNRETFHDNSSLQIFHKQSKVSLSQPLDDGKRNLLSSR